MAGLFCCEKLLSDLSRCGWESLKEFFTVVVPVEDPVFSGKEDAMPGAVIAVQTFGDFLGFHPHLHILYTDGCFYGNGMFRPALARGIWFKAETQHLGALNDPLLMLQVTRSRLGVAPLFELKHLEAIFQHKVFKMLLFKKKMMANGIVRRNSMGFQFISQNNLDAV